MKKVLACAVVAVGLFPFTVQAGERVLDGGLGAAAGGAAFGWPGVVAGGLVGYVKGPDIAHTLGLKGHRRHYRRHARR
jgi:hypothetical protein